MDVQLVSSSTLARTKSYSLVRAFIHVVAQLSLQSAMKLIIRIAQKNSVATNDDGSVLCLMSDFGNNKIMCTEPIV